MIKFWLTWVVWGPVSKHYIAGNSPNQDPMSKFSSSLSVRGQQHSEKDWDYLLKVFKQMQALDPTHWLFRWSHDAAQANIFLLPGMAPWVRDSNNRLLLLQPFPQNELHALFLGRMSRWPPTLRQARWSSRAPQPSPQQWLVWWSWSREETTALHLSWGRTTPLDPWLTMMLV